MSFKTWAQNNDGKAWGGSDHNSIWGKTSTHRYCVECNDIFEANDDRWDKCKECLPDVFADNKEEE